MAGEPVTNLMVTTDITVGGMTCAACVRRVEKKLAKLEGVTATVNLATGLARVSHPESVPAQELVTAVEQAGYQAALPAPPAREEEGTADADASDAVARQERERLLVTALLAVPVLVLSMVPALQFRNWQWLCFALAAPVAVWSAWPFHTRAVRGLRHSTATMDTLVSLGVVASFSWSAYALFLGGAGDPGMRMPFSLLPSASDETAHVYLEAAVSVPLFVLTGRFLEARARRGTGAALRSLAELAAKEVSVRDEHGERAIPIEQLRVGQVFVVRPGERVATDGCVTEGSSAVDLSPVTGESEPVEVSPGSALVGGAVNVGGLLLVRATAVGADTQLARITRLVTDAQAGKAKAQRLADAVAGVFVPVVLSIAVTVLGFWLGAGADPQAALTACVAVLVCVDGRAEALIAVGDLVRPGSYRAVDQLRRLGIRPVLATGDRKAPAQAVAGALGIEDVHARCSPEDKAALVRRLQEEGHRVAVVGDGVNDAAALAGADLGIAMGTGTDVAIGAADLTLVRGDI